NLLVRLFGLREEPAYRLIGLGAGAGVVPGPRQATPRLRAPRDDADSFGGTQRQHLALLLAVEQVDEVLHADKPGPAVALGHCERLAELPSIHRRGADIARLARLHDVVQCLERFLDRRLVIPAMNLVEVDVIHAEPAQAGVDLAHDCFARQAAAVRTGAHPAIYLGRNDHLVAAGEILDSPSEDLLA